MAKKKKNNGHPPKQRSGKSAARNATLPAYVPIRQPGPGEERFLLEALLGSGGICEVYAALDLRRVEWGDANPKVAIKRLRPEFNDNVQARLSLAQEFCALRHLAHPGVVRTFDLHREPFGICFSMELLEGHTLQEELQSSPSGLGHSAGYIGQGIFDALLFLHSHGVVHGDIKPSNIFLAPEGRIAFIDFNVSTATAQVGAACSPITRGLRERLHLPSYSLRYASPERLQGGNPSAPDDVFAACCTFYEAVAGSHPFGRRSSLEAMQEEIVPARPMGMPSAQWDLVLKGLSFESGLRPTAGVLRAGFFRQGFLRDLAGAFYRLMI